MDVLLLSVMAGLVAVAIALAWSLRRSRRHKIAELQKNERIDLFGHDRD